MSLWSLRWLLPLTLSLPALAAPAALSDSELEALAAKVDKADKLFKGGKYQEALPIYREAYQLTEEPTMLFSMGQCHRNLQQNKEAADAYRRFLAAAPKDSELRPLAQQLLGEMEATLPKEEANPERSRAPFLYVGAGGAAALGAGAGVFSLVSAVKAKELQDGADPDDFQQVEDLTRRATIFGVAADALFVSAAVLGVAGFVIAKKSKSGDAAVLVGPSGATLQVRF